MAPYLLMVAAEAMARLTNFYKCLSEKVPECTGTGVYRLKCYATELPMQQERYCPVQLRAYLYGYVQSW